MCLYTEWLYKWRYIPRSPQEVNVKLAHPNWIIVRMWLALGNNVHDCMLYIEAYSVYNGILIIHISNHTVNEWMSIMYKMDFVTIFRLHLILMID